MSRSTEKVLKQAISFIQQQAENKDVSTEEMNLLLQQFMTKQNQALQAEESGPDVYDYLELADQATTKKKKREYLEKAKEIAPDDLDVLLQLLLLDQPKNPVECLKTYEELLAKGKADLMKDGTYSESRGMFWGVFETRPYMRVMGNYMDVLTRYGMFSKAVSVGQEMMKLCTNDNLGIRYKLMCLYTRLEDKSHALKLARQFKEELSYSTRFLLPLAILSFKLGDFDKAKEYVMTLKEENPDFKKFVTLVVWKHWFKIPSSGYAYQPGTMEELVIVMEDPTDLVYDNFTFFTWAKALMVVRRKPQGKK